MEVHWYADCNGISEVHVKVTERSPIDLSMTLRLFIEIEPSKLGQWGLLGIFSHAVHNVTLYDFIFACKNNFSIGMITILATKWSGYNKRTASNRAMRLGR